jgi:hypothetical protein
MPQGTVTEATGAAFHLKSGAAEDRILELSGLKMFQKFEGREDE